MPRRDYLKNRLEELFSAPEGLEPAFPVEGAAEARRAESNIADSQRNMPEAPERALAAEEQPAAVTASGEVEYGAVFEQLGVGMAITGLDESLIRVNPAFCAMLDYSPDEIIGRSLQDVTHPEDHLIGAETMMSMLSGAVRTGRMEMRFLTMDGRPVLVDLNTTLIMDAAGQPQFFVTIAREVTERDALLESLQAQARRERTVQAIASRVRTAVDADAILRTAVRELGSALGRKTFIELDAGDAPESSQPEAGGTAGGSGKGI